MFCFMNLFSLFAIFLIKHERFFLESSFIKSEDIAVEFILPIRNLIHNANVGAYLVFRVNRYRKA